MYDGSLGGIDTHADDCQVQINFFISPSSANLWSEDDSLPSGGLVLYGVGPPADWKYTDYNSIVQNPRIDEILQTTNYWNVTIPYLENRAVLFDSTYFHKTDCMRFKKGYKNRRINDPRLWHTCLLDFGSHERSSRSCKIPGAAPMVLFSFNLKSLKDHFCTFELHQHPTKRFRVQGLGFKATLTPLFLQSLLLLSKLL